MLEPMVQEMLRRLYGANISYDGIAIYTRCCDRYQREHDGKAPVPAPGVLQRIADEEAKGRDSSEIEELAYNLVKANSSGLLPVKHG